MNTSSKDDQKSPNENQQSPAQAVKTDENDDDDDEERQVRSPSSENFHNENSNSSVHDAIKSDVSTDEPPPIQKLQSQSMPPPTRSSPTKGSKGANSVIDDALNFCNKFTTMVPTKPLQPLLSLSENEDKADTASVKEKKRKDKNKRPSKRTVPPPEDSSSDEDSGRYSSSGRRRSKKSISNTHPLSSSTPTQFDVIHSDASSKSGAKKSHKPSSSTRKDQSSTKNRRNASGREPKSNAYVSTSDSSDEDEKKPPSTNNTSNNNVKANIISSSPSPVKQPSRPQKFEPKPVTKNDMRKGSSIEKLPISSSSSDSDSEPSNKYQSPVPPHSSNSESEPSDSDDSTHTAGKVQGKKIEKGLSVSDKNKFDTLKKLFQPKAGTNSEGLGKGGKNGGKKPIGQVVVITPDESNKPNDSTNSSATSVQSHPKYSSPTSAFTEKPSVMVRIDLARIDLSRLKIPAEKLKNTVIRTKSPSIPTAVVAPTLAQTATTVSNVEQRPKSNSLNKKRRRSIHEDDDQKPQNERDGRKIKSRKTFDQLSVSSTSSSSSSNSSTVSEHRSNTSNNSSSNVNHSENFAASRVSFPQSNNFQQSSNNDRLNNNIDHKPKDFNKCYHSPSSVDTKLPKIKREQQQKQQQQYKNEFRTTSASPMKDSKSSDSKAKIKLEREEVSNDGAQGIRNRSTSVTTPSSQSYKDKRKRDKKVYEIISSSANENPPMPPTNHDRLSGGLVNGDCLAPPIIKRVYVSYFERNNDGSEQAEMR